MDSRLGTGSVYEPIVLMEGVGGQLEHHNKQNTMRKKTKVGLQFYFYDYYNHTRSKKIIMSSFSKNNVFF